jgi:hypothetical protein
MRIPEVPMARKNVLLASASILAMAVACSDVSAADLPVLPTKAPAAIEGRMELVGRRRIHRSSGRGSVYWLLGAGYRDLQSGTRLGSRHWIRLQAW